LLAYSCSPPPYPPVRAPPRRRAPKPHRSRRVSRPPPRLSCPGAQRWWRRTWTIPLPPFPFRSGEGRGVLACSRRLGAPALPGSSAHRPPSHPLRWINPRLVCQSRCARIASARWGKEEQPTGMGERGGGGRDEGAARGGDRSRARSSDGGSRSCAQGKGGGGPRPGWRRRPKLPCACCCALLPPECDEYSICQMGDASIGWCLISITGWDPCDAVISLFLVYLPDIWCSNYISHCFIQEGPGVGDDKDSSKEEIKPEEAQEAWKIREVDHEEWQSEEEPPAEYSDGDEILDTNASVLDAFWFNENRSLWIPKLSQV
ncbi:unnamed protein product, partial [Urochloa humidicola]